ncbi:hypothetical protein KP509_14G008400 [Ceratopteris richardii]|uniref:Gamma-tubulin complex component n=2 Tax=Ceratopteris richardii TaxID=49495 RepID=A0A8T2TC53_CERRI|nr:hypothetical protein KP509_14G008400 [Ceratopteris richardii]
MMEDGSCLIERLSQVRCVDVPFAVPKQESRSTEARLVKDVLQMIQGYSSSSFFWDESSQSFSLNRGFHLSHLSESSLRSLLARFINAASSLRRIDSLIERVASRLQAFPTVQAFTSAVSLSLKHLRKGALEKELFAVRGGAGTSITLLGLLSNLSRVCAGSEVLELIVNEAVPNAYIFDEGISAAELGAHILSYLYEKMSDYCLLQDGEEEAYGTLLVLFAGTLQPLTEALNSWLHDGFLDDPFGELFFYENKSVGIEDATFWQNGFLLRYYKPDRSMSDLYGHESKDQTKLSMSASFLQNKVICPKFLQHMAQSILSAGKSLQLLQHVHRENTGDGSSVGMPSSPSSLHPSLRCSFTSSSSLNKERIEYVKGASVCLPCTDALESSNFDMSWDILRMEIPNCVQRSFLSEVKPGKTPMLSNDETCDRNIPSSSALTNSAVPSQNPGSVWDSVLSSQCAIPPPINDDDIYSAIFSICHVDDSEEEGCSNNADPSTIAVNLVPRKVKILTGTDYSAGYMCGKLLSYQAKMDSVAMQRLFPDATVLPSSKEWSLFGPRPMQSHNRFAEQMFRCLGKVELKVTQLPRMLVQECLINPLKRQVENVGRQVLHKLMNEWRLMEELYVLRAVYLIGSGDLLQQFSSVLFNKLDRGEPWDDFYELNTMLQESVRSSADGALLPALDSLVVTVQNKSSNVNENVPGQVPLHIPGRNLSFGIDILDSLHFVYKVSWPLELIINENAIKKYNQAMSFLFKVKRAKFALDKACRWMWKDGGVRNMTNMKQLLLLQQKLMHFVNTLHQYVLDRVLYSAWEELRQGMAMACSLDEVIACHDSYLVSIQRQCLVAPDKLWALISSRVKTILSLALEFYSIQRTMFGGGAAPAIKARCQLEIERIGRQFEECIVFLLRVLSFKLNVGHFPHLAELVTRINFNFYYVSESGHLLTPLPEVTSKKGSQQSRVSGMSLG